MTSQTPKRTNRIQDKLLGIEIRARKIEDLAYKSRHSGMNNDSEIRRNLRLLGSIYNELWTFINTSEEQGQRWGWWE